MRFITSLLLAIALFIPSQTLADIELLPTQTFKVLLVCGHAVNCPRAMKVLKDATEYLKAAIPVDFKLVGVVSIPHDMSGSPEERLAKWQKATQTERVKSGADFVIVSLTPYPSSLQFIDFRAESVLGMANDFCSVKKKDSLAFAKLVGNDVISARLMAHEMGHLFGAFHDEAYEGLMAPWANQNQHADSFSQNSIDQMHDCLFSLSNIQA